MRMLFTGLLSVFLFSAKAQTKRDSISFITENLVKMSAKAFANYDYDQHFSLVSEDAVLVLVDLSKIENKQGYRDIIMRIGNIQKSKGVSRTIQFRYNKFSINSGLAYAEGIFKITLSNTKEGIQRLQYSAFKHVYRLEKGQWRVFMDSHTTNPGLTEDDFLKAQEIGDVQ